VNTGFEDGVNILFQSIAENFPHVLDAIEKRLVLELTKVKKDFRRELYHAF